MSAPYDCFEKIIGLAEYGCECYDAGLGDGASESASGLQLASLEGLNMSVLNRAASCSTGGTLGLLLNAAREEGIRRYKEEVLKYIRANTKVKRAPVRSQVGDNKNSLQPLTMGNTYHGVSLTLAHHVGGTAKVKRIGTYMDFTGTINVKQYGLDSSTPTSTTPCATVQNVLTWTNVDIDLSMEVEGSRNPEHWFLWEPTGGQRALNSRVHCGCGGRRSWNESPWFESGVKDNDQAWMRWAMGGGTKGDTLSEREDWNVGNETQGLILDIEFGCEFIRSICDGVPDYEDDPLQMSAAYAVRYAAGSYIVSHIISSTDVSRETLTGDGENLYKQRATYDKAFYERAHDYIGATLVQPPDEGMPASGVNTYSDCFTCKEKSGFRAGHIGR